MHRPLVALLPLVLLAGTLSACNTAYRRAVARAEAATAAGDLHGAALAWRDACRHDPDGDACPRAREAARAFVAEAVAAAAPACAAGDPDGCSRAILPAYLLSPDDPEATRLLDESARLHAARCPPETPGDPAAEIARLSCLEAWRTAAPTPTYRARLDELARSLAGELARRAGAAEARELPAATHALLSTAACLDPSYRPAAAEAQRVIRERGIPLSLAVRAAGRRAPAAERLCEDVRGTIPVVSCGGGEGTPLEVDVWVDLGKARYAVEETEHVARRLVEVREVPNPAYGAVAERLRHLDNRVDSAAREAKRLRERCEADRLRNLERHDEWDHSCRRALEAEDKLREREREADRVRDELAGIPPTLPEEIWVTVPYRERLHRWTAPLAARIEGPEGRPVAATPPGGVLVHEDLERPAIPDVGVAGDPFEELPPGHFEELAARALGGPLATWVGEALAARAADRAAGCDGEGPAWSPAWLACRAEAAEWRGRPVREELLTAPGALAPLPCK